MSEKSKVQLYKETELLELIRDAVDDLHRIGDRLERYANEQLEAENQHAEGESDA